jgi:hypothetical protein
MRQGVHQISRHVRGLLEIRGQELRRKILAGAIVLAKIESGEMDRGQFRHWLDQGLTRADDRELFELPVRDAE